ncbi:hypothetical protein B0H11DRAFT_2288000 [Mycena galericulata]|nr:hypothetical protein B0H11DRAFT_2288000 [Mycena galericulata]
MFSKVISALLLTALAGRVMAFNVTIGKTVFQADEVLDFTFTPVIQSCQAQCQSAAGVIAACNANDTACFCKPDTTGPLETCEQCMFTTLVDTNQPQPDVRAGANQVLAGWTANCATNFTLAAPLALTLPDSWDGPFVSVFPESIGIVIAAIGGILGSSLIYMLCNM